MRLQEKSLPQYDLYLPIYFLIEMTAVFSILSLVVDLARHTLTFEAHSEFFLS